MKTFQQFIQQGIPTDLQQTKSYDSKINHAPKRKEILNEEEKKLALKNALRYFEPKYHAELLPEFKEELRGFSLDFKEAEHVEQAIADADVILVEPVVQPDYTQSRQEAGDRGLTPDNYKITRELLYTKAKPDAILLHSLPRMDEIPTDVDITRWSRYWQEAFNGVVMRMALLALVLGKME